MDGWVTHAGPRRVGRVLAQQLEGDPVRLGQILLLSAGTVVAGTVPLLGPDAHGWRLLAGVSAVMVGVLLASLVLPWAKLPQVAAMLFPGAVMAGLTALGVGAGLGAPYGGLFVLCFAYTGLTQTAKANVWVVPPAAVGYAFTQASWSATTGVRLLIVTAVWVLLSQLLAALGVLGASQRELTVALRAAAYTDVLTGLPNRRSLQLQLTAAAPNDVVVLCDLDWFKQLNDTRGHAAGDRVLSEFGTLLRTTLRAGDYAARYGGEEFALLLPDTTVAQARALLARLRQHWAVLHPQVTFSAGLSRRGQHRDGDSALCEADRALYSAKAAGRDRDGVSAHA